uniref:Uncharacterized protein n=1 Tax=Myotis myotis TaxID=51298 RepID=A0A7J7TTW5_MYOMY|nr:hypothetical protein mMyoMyo1_009000 [Myotis myotis]
MIPGHKKLPGSVAGAHSKKPPACVETMRGCGHTQCRSVDHAVCGLGTLIPPRSVAQLGVPVPGAWQLPVCTVLKLTHSGAGFWPLSLIPGLSSVTGLAQLLKDEGRWPAKSFRLNSPEVILFSEVEGMGRGLGAGGRDGLTESTSSPHLSSTK